VAAFNMDHYRAVITRGSQLVIALAIAVTAARRDAELKILFFTRRERYKSDRSSAENRRRIVTWLQYISILSPVSIPYLSRIGFISVVIGRRCSDRKIKSRSINFIYLIALLRIALEMRNRATSCARDGCFDSTLIMERREQRVRYVRHGYTLGSASTCKEFFKAANEECPWQLGARLTWRG